MPCGVILREALKFDVVAAVVLYDQSHEGEPAVRLSDLKPNLPQKGDGVFWNFFDWIDKSNFEVSADAFTTFRVRIGRPVIWGTVATDPSAIGNPDPA